MPQACPAFLQKIIGCILLSCFLLNTGAQTGNFPLSIKVIDKDSSFAIGSLKIQNQFGSQAQAVDYITKLPQVLAAKGYPVASVDSIISTDSVLHAWLFLGPQFDWIQLKTNGIEKKALDQTGFNEKQFSGKAVNMQQLLKLQEKLLQHYENEGHPFARVYIDSIVLNEKSIAGNLKADKGILYHVDSIRIMGNAKLNKYFLQRYLAIPNGSIYSKQRLQEVDKRLLELPYLTTVQPSDITMLGNGAVLNLYIQPKKSSQVNFLVGFLPSANNTNKLQVTGDVNLDLKNLLAGGESFLLKWQQLQPKSPRLNIGFNKPFIFRSAFGLDLLFDLFKKDSSFLQLNAQLGMQYILSASQTGKLFVQWQSTSLLEGGIDTNAIRLEKKLPPNIDVSATNVGLSYEWNKTNYRFNPRYGNEIIINTSVGIKNISRNNDVINLKDPAFNYASLYDSIKLKSYQWRARVTAAHYFPVGKSATFKLGFNGGYYNSPAIFRNELFQIGGFKLLRGFDEESIYATRFAVATAEYRLLINLNSYLAFFSDAGFSNNRYLSVNVNNQFISGGIGIVYETKLGLLNLSYAAGKRNDIPFNLRTASKVHFGYVNYF